MQGRSILQCLAVAAAFPAGVLANHIDFFEDGAFSLSADAGGGGSGAVRSATVTGIPTSTTLGGARFINLSISTAAASASLNPVNNLGTAVDDDALSFVAAGNAILTVFIGADAQDFLNANFLDIPNSAADWDRVRVDFGSGSSASPQVAVSLFSDGEGFASLAKQFGGGDANLDFLYSDFFAANSAFTADTLRDIDGARLSLSSAGGSFLIESFNRNGFVLPQAQVPEPGSLALLAISAVGLLTGIRSRVRGSATRRFGSKRG